MVSNDQNKLRVLIVDDSAINRSILNKILSDEYSVTEAADGDEAIRILTGASAQTDIIMLDLFMPNVSGWDVLSTIGQDDKLRNIPVIVISGEDDHDLVDRAYEMGAVDYVAKPFVLKTVKQRVAMAVSKKEK